MSIDTDKRLRFEAIAAEIFDPVQRYLQRRVGPNDAQDLLSEVLMTIWRRIDDVPDGDQVLPWTYGVARRMLANHRRASGRRLRLVGRLEFERQPAFVSDPADAGPDPELIDALGRLSEDDREIIRLWAWEQLEPREIAPVLGVSVNAATIRLSRARRRLARDLGRQNSDVDGHPAVEDTQEHRDD